MQFNIEDVRDIGKLLGVLRSMARGEFKVAKEVFDETLMRLHHAVKERGIDIIIISPSGERIIEFTARGIIVGAIAGFYVGQIPGALIGAVVGGFTGYCAAHMTLVMDLSDDADHVVFRIA
jgi:hypothetical protein